MALLQDIQSELLNPAAKIGPILLKLRFLADRLGSDILEEWVKHETEGYPESAPVPDYRKCHVAYKGTFTNGVQTLNSVPIPPYIVSKEAGEKWNIFELRESIAVVDAILDGSTANELNKYGVSAGNMIMLLQDKIYPGYSLISVTGTFGGSPFATIHQSGLGFLI